MAFYFLVWGIKISYIYSALVSALSISNVIKLFIKAYRERLYVFLLNFRIKLSKLWFQKIIFGDWIVPNLSNMLQMIKIIIPYIVHIAICRLILTFRVTRKNSMNTPQQKKNSHMTYNLDPICYLIQMNASCSPILRNIIVIF